MKTMMDGSLNPGSGGENDLSVNWFDIVSRKLMNELGLLINNCCKKVLFPPKRGHGAQRHSEAP